MHRQMLRCLWKSSGITAIAGRQPISFRYILAIECNAMQCHALSDYLQAEDRGLHRQQGSLDRPWISMYLIKNRHAGKSCSRGPRRSLLWGFVLLQIARDAEYLQKNVLQPAAASNGGQQDKPQKFLDRVKSLRTMHSGHSKPPSKAVSFPSGSQVQRASSSWPCGCA